VERERDDYIISTDRGRLDLDVSRDFLGAAYWSPDMPREVLERSIEHSLVFGLFAPDGAQVGLARVLTDRAAFVYLADVFVLEGHRERGQWLVETVLSHPDLRGMRQVLLGTEGAHSLYVFEPAGAERMMTLERPNRVAG
jgi:GNAT superfamily N-acetyltransferase